MGTPRRDPDSEQRSAPVSQPWWLAAAALAILPGALWLWCAARGGPAGVVLGGPPGALLLSTGVSSLLWAADERIFQFMALGSASGTALAIPAGLVFGPVAGLVLLASSAASFLAAGYLGVGQEPVPEGVPEPRMDVVLAFRAAADELSMCGIALTTWPLPLGPRAARISREMETARGMFERAGWLEDPASYHRTPPPLREPLHQSRDVQGHAFEHVSFESEYEPWPGEPGRDRWLSYERNRTAHAWVMRHSGGPRPWLLCIHGIRMGSPQRDFSLFQPDYLHRRLGMNLLLPILPIHGPRRAGPAGGDRILSGDTMDLIHAGAQAIWDIRRLLLWLRSSGEGVPSVGVLGHSLGGYVAALLCCLEAELDFVFAGNPAVDPSHMFWRSAPSLATRSLRSEGIRETEMSELLRVVSPLALRPLVPREQRAIFAGVADRVVPATEARKLWRHWEEPRIAWYRGTHRGFLHTPEGQTVLTEILRAAGALPDGI